MSRPHELTPEILAAAKHYTETGHAENGEIIPTISGLALYLGKSKSTLHKWQAENEEMAETIDLLQCKQETRLISGGLTGDYNPSFAKLLLAKHGYSEKTDIDHTSGGQIINGNFPTVIELVAPDYENWSDAAKSLN